MYRIARPKWRRRWNTAAVSLVAVVTGACGSATSTGSVSPTLSARTTSQLDHAILKAMRQEGIPGAIVGVWTRNGSYVRAFGVSNIATRSPMQVSFYQRIGSITKTFTITAVLQLVDQGKLSLDDPISKYIAGVPDGTHITIRELARMQSGLFDYVSDEGFEQSLVTSPYQEWSSDQLLQIAFRHPLVFPPGTDFQYSNTNTVLLGLVIQTVTGQLPASYIDQHVLKPLHLDHTAFPKGSQFPNPHAQGYTEILSPGQPMNVTMWNPSWGGVAGAMYSNLNDMRIWARVLGTGALLTPSTQGQRLQAVPYKNEPVGTSYGLGVEGFSGWLGHCGDLVGYNSLELYLPSQQATLVIFTNMFPSKDRSRTPVVVVAHLISKIISPSNVIPLFDGPDG